MWLISQSLHNELHAALSAGWTPSAEQQLQFEARFNPAPQGNLGDRILTIEGNTATIGVSGVLTEQPDIRAMIFGGGNVTYGELVAAAKRADANPNVEKIVFNVDSGGGTVKGLFSALDEIAALSTPTESRVLNTAASAAYAFVSKTDRVVATNRAARVGSIGIAAELFTGGNTKSIVSTKAPNKRPDVTTEEGEAAVRGELDALHELFTDAIAEGRGVSKEKIDADFGKGGILLAEDALKRGMIDAISARSATPQTASNGGNSIKASSTMNEKELLAQHPATHAAIVAEATKTERERVEAHLILGEASGDMATAMAAIKDGSEMTALINAKYQAAGMKKAAAESFHGDDTSAAEGAGGETANLNDSVVNALAAEFGVELGA